MMKGTISDTEWLTPGEAAKLLKVHVSTIYRWGEKGKIRLYRVGKRCARLKRSEIEEMAREKQKPSEKTPDTIYQWLSTVFLPLAQKHRLDKKEAKQFLSELLRGISSKKYDVHRSFNQMLEGVRHAFEQLVKSKTVDRHFEVICKALENGCSKNTAKTECPCFE